MRAAPFLLLLATAGCVAARQQPALGPVVADSATAHVLLVDGRERSYLLHIPASFAGDPGRQHPLPLLLLLHGSGADGRTIERMSRMDSLATARQFVVAYPNGSTRWLGFGGDWNAGDCCGAAAERGVDDVAFLRAVLADVEALVPVDRARIYVAGFSDGGRMAYRAGCEMADEIAAIGVVAGSLVDAQCQPTRPLPVIAFHGTADAEVPFDAALPTPFASALSDSATVDGLSPSVAFWARYDGCRSRSVGRIAPHLVEWQFSSCAGDSEVRLYATDRGTHVWPGVERDVEGDQPISDLTASGSMMDFLLRHELWRSVVVR